MQALLRSPAWSRCAHSYRRGFTNAKSVLVLEASMLNPVNKQIFTFQNPPGPSPFLPPDTHHRYTPCRPFNRGCNCGGVHDEHSRLESSFWWLPTTFDEKRTS
ncbi:hypothetical protein J3458_004143 [Metarhizium acridum]|uniref:uncharacterized protein n=1 Tax=Metarhizium acridum TaxID=92637 RepID=UPI001C6CCD5C|nr:hypothetical protein J3458_004143 [Metarhizium acridum]